MAFFCFFDGLYHKTGRLRSKQRLFFRRFSTNIKSIASVCSRPLRPVGCAPPGAPCGRARPAPASDGVAVLARVDGGVRRYMTTVASFVLGNNICAFFFCPMRLRSLDSGRLFSAKIASPHRTVHSLTCGRFCGTFSAAPARFLTSAQVFAPSRPARGCAPLDPRQGSPCTCPASPFMAKPGLCFTYPAYSRKTNCFILFPAPGTTFFYIPLPEFKLKRGTGARREIDHDAPPPLCFFKEPEDGFCDQRMQRESRRAFCNEYGAGVYYRTRSAFAKVSAGQAAPAQEQGARLTTMRRRFDFSQKKVEFFFIRHLKLRQRKSKIGANRID